MSLAKSSGSADRAIAEMLVPGQVMRRTSSSGPRSLEDSSSVNRTSAGDNRESQVTAPSKNQNENSGKKNQRRRRNRKKKPNVESSTEETTKEETKLASNNKQKKPRRRKNQKHPWRTQVPPESVDPITLEPIVSLHYPPFALAAVPPYNPIPVWPIVALEQQRVASSKESEEERQRRILAEQWGGTAGIDTARAPEESSSPQHVNLYDGRALAYYMVSQLQFIDPLNRRDLTRDELVNLDEYLVRHGFTKLNVTEAYDAKGTTISTASAVGNTAQGRAAILQQEASILLSALFGGGIVSSNLTDTGRSHGNSVANTNRLTDLYLAHEQQERATANHSRQQNIQQQSQDVGVYGDGGLLVIDDDLNPGLRAHAAEFVPGRGTVVTTPQSHHASFREREFPSLNAAPRSSKDEPKPPPPPPPPRLPTSKSLSKVIGKMVQKTDPEEVQRQFEAREEARRRAMAANLTFQSTAAQMQPTSQQAIPATITTTSTVPSEAQLERNRAFAQALAIQPSTIRQQLNTGWARPTEFQPSLDEFGNELNATEYPVTLIQQAKERIPLVLKLEKKWKAFLADDSAASLPLNKMDRPSRAFVHEYSDYWKLNTESFDPEPNRYVHCVKLRDTCAPFPMLSEVARRWRGPALDHPSMQTAGQTTKGGRSVVPSSSTPEWIPLPLRKPSASSSATRALGGIPLSGLPSRSTTDEVSSRFASLSTGERPKLELKKRTLPLDQPPLMESMSKPTFDVNGALEERKRRVAEQAEQKRAENLKAQRLLESVFASDDEEEAGRNGDDSSSEWDEQEALYAGSDDYE